MSFIVKVMDLPGVAVGVGFGVGLVKLISKCGVYKVISETEKSIFQHYFNERPKAVVDDCIEKNFNIVLLTMGCCVIGTYFFKAIMQRNQAH